MASSSAIGTSTEWVNKLSEEQRKGLVLLQIYSRVCRNLYGPSYRSDPITDESCVNRPAFKQAVTVAKWLTTIGMPVGMGERHWQAYMEYVFDRCKRTGQVPAVGQIANPVIFKKYCQHASFSSAPPEDLRSDRDLEKLYSKVVVPTAANDLQVMLLLGLVRANEA